MEQKKEMGEEGQVIVCRSLKVWKEQTEKAKISNSLVVVNFTASWCGPCRLISPFLVELAKKLPNVMFLKVDVDELESVSMEYKVEAMPTFVLLKEGKIVERIVGVKREKLQETIALHMATSSA